MLSELGIIRLNAGRGFWEFCDSQHLVSNSRETYVVYDDEVYFSGALRHIRGTDQLNPIFDRFGGTMTSPTTEIEPEYQWLNEISFDRFLRNEGVVLNDLLRVILNDCMWDDYGAGIEKVSALAGVHYFLCRPETSPSARAFSPPQGNHYFARKLYDHLDPQRVLCSHAVLGIRPVKDFFQVQVLDCIRSEITQITTPAIVFAAHKHALKYIYPPDSRLFAHNQYAPWMVINSVFENPPLPKPAFWQNQLLDVSPWFTSFVNLSALTVDAGSPWRIISSYVCLPESMRDDLLRLPHRIEYWTEFMLDYINETLKVDMKSHCVKAIVTPHGHAMPIPVPGYLFKDANARRSHTCLVYAGVDNGRLPLLIEAIDSGIQAAKAAAAS